MKKLLILTPLLLAAIAALAVATVPTLTPRPIVADSGFPAREGDSSTSPEDAPLGSVFAPAVLTFTPVADAYVNVSKPDANYGAAEVLRTDADPETRAYLRFQVEGVLGAVTRASLRVYAETGSTGGFDVRVVTDESWTEGAVTYANAPVVGNVVGSSDAINAGSWAQVDVTTLVTGNGALSLALSSTSSTAVRYASRETGSRAPQLVVETGGAVAGVAATATPTDASGDFQPGPPIRAAFYYPWFPEAWAQQGHAPFTNYSPSRGLYDSSNPGVIREHIAAMQYGYLDAGISSWWGQGTPTDVRFADLLAVASGTTFRWAVHYELESQRDPTVAELEADLRYLADHYGHDPSYLRVDGRFVVFAYTDEADGCDMATRWKQANTVDAYVVLKVFRGYRECRDQPDGWHQYGPALAADSQGVFSYSISPGFWKAGAAPRLQRDPERWKANVRDMIASGATFQLVTTFNEWGEGTAIESATEWASASGYGVYLDALHEYGAKPVATTVSDAPVLIAVGDIADCKSEGDEATALLVDWIAGAVATLGDTVYETGSAEQFANCYQPSWGRHRERTFPAVGNHEYLTEGAAPYFDYFGAAAGAPDKGYYSYDLGSWHIVVLNSNCSKSGGCGAGSPQEQWLRADLAAHPTVCTLAYWHHPRFSSGQHGSFEAMRPIWQALYEAGAELVLSGHDHNYERFAPQDADGNADPQRGIRQFVVGTGGKNHYPVPATRLRNSEVANDDTYGVLKLTLHPSSYDWEFIPVAGKTFTDAGSEACH